jgi:hypothetical protein
LVKGLKQHADRASLDSFAWDLFARWQASGALLKDRWTMIALGLLGGVTVCFRLSPLVLEWPGQHQHKRAVQGLECLRAIGSEQALLQLHKLSEKMPSSALREKAGCFVQEIASERGLSPAQLEDRLIPDLGLDEQGTRLIDYGPRRFCLTLGPDLKPRIRDEEGNVHTDLPKPTVKDDATTARAIQAEWKQFQKLLKEAIDVHGERLEKAMMCRRRWRVEEFQKHLVCHPLMRYLVRALLWAAFDGEGKVSTLFRVTEDGICVDAGGEPVTLEVDWRIGIVHPLFVSPDDLRQWTKVFSDHHIVPPFPQLGRRVFRLDSSEVGEKILKRFEGTKLAGMKLIEAMKKAGWERDSANEQHRIIQHFKRFPAVGLTAFFSYRPGLEPYYGYGEVEDQELVGCWFVADGKCDALPLGEVDALVLDEVAAMLHALAGG